MCQIPAGFPKGRKDLTPQKKKRAHPNILVTGGAGFIGSHAAVARYASMQKGLDILNCCVLDLIQEMVDAIKKGTYYAFLTSLMRLDALFIDNIWLLQNSRQTALAVFSLFEAFADKGGLVMIASDLPPSLLSEWAPAKR